MLIRAVRSALIASGFVLLCLSSSAVSASVGPRYLSPQPGADRVSRWNNIVLGVGSAIEPASLAPHTLSVTGNMSGDHDGRLKLTRDGRSIVFVPSQPFALGETVRVRLGDGVRQTDGTAIAPLDFEFRVSGTDPRTVARVESERVPGAPAVRPAPAAPIPLPGLLAPCDPSLPGFPALRTAPVGDPIPGAYFASPFSPSDRVRADFEIMDERGYPLYVRTFARNSVGVDFKVQHDGRLSYWMTGTNNFHVMDSAYAVVDSFVTGNGYFPDLHDLQLFPDGSALMIAYDPQPVRMDTVVAGGDPNATVIGFIVQELDPDHDVVFQWRSWDHFKITDASVSRITDLKANIIDYVHGNSVERMLDGNILISSRHMNELTKIDRRTGEVLWRMGPHAVNNQFAFPNDPRGFSHQHDARILPNGHLTLFDNGNDLVPEYSRALEYELDETNRVATLVWEYRHTPDVSALFMGNVQRHADGSTTIGWGGTTADPRATDVRADGSVAAEINYPSDRINYRLFRHEWRTNRFQTDVRSLDLYAPSPEEPGVRTVQVRNTWDRPVSIDCLQTADPRFAASIPGAGLPVVLAPGEQADVEVRYTPVTAEPVDSRLYLVQQGSDELVAQTVELHGRYGNGPVGVGGRLILESRVRPNPAPGRATIRFTLAERSPVTVDIQDVRGRRTVRLLDQELDAGEHSVEWSTSQRRKGVFFCLIRARGQVHAQKFVVAK